MTKILYAIILMPSLLMAQPAGFINPLTFDNTEAQKQKVIAYIKDESLHKYCYTSEDSCHPFVLQLAQSDNLSAFLKLSTIQNKEYLNSLIKEYCNSEFFQCSYENILEVYEENLWCDVKLGDMRSIQNSEYQSRIYPNPISVDSRADLIP